MKLVGALAALRQDRRGAIAIEFAMIAPLLIAMLLGVLMIGLHMQAYNSVRSAVFDTERFTVVEYQRENRMLPVQIEEVAIAIASRTPYNLNPDNLEVCVTLDNTMVVTGATKYDLEMKYRPQQIAGVFGISPPLIAFSQSIIVPGTGVAPGSCNEPVS